MPYHVLAHTSGIPYACAAAQPTGTPLLLSITGEQGNTVESDEYEITAQPWPTVNTTSAEQLPCQWSMLIKRTGGGGAGGIRPYGYYGMKIADYAYGTSGGYLYPADSDQVEGLNFTGNACVNYHCPGGAGGTPVDPDWLLVQCDQNTLMTRAWWGYSLADIDPDTQSPELNRGIPNNSRGTLYIRPYQTAAQFKFAHGLHKWTSDPF